MTVRLPSDAEKLRQLWAGLSSPAERAEFLDAAIVRNRFEAFAAACHAPASVGPLQGKKVYDKLAEAIAKHDSLDLLDALDRIDPRLGLQVRQLHGATPRRDMASRAIAHHAGKVFARLLDEGVDVLSNDKSYGTSLCHMVACYGWLEGMELIQQRLGPQHALADARGRTTLHSAARHGHPQMVQFLLDQGGDIMAKDCHGRDVFFFCLMGHAETLGMSRSPKWSEAAQVLLKAGADLDAPSGKTTRSASLRNHIAQNDPAFLPEIEQLCQWVRGAALLEEATPAAQGVSSLRRI